MGQPGLAWAWPELALTIRQDSFTAWKARAGICLSSEIRAPGQRGEVLPWKNQLLPLSARMSPYCCISTSTAWASAQNGVPLPQNPDTEKLAFSRNLAPMGGSEGLVPDPAAWRAGHR